MYARSVCTYAAPNALTSRIRSPSGLTRLEYPTYQPQSYVLELI